MMGGRGGASGLISSAQRAAEERARDLDKLKTDLETGYGIKVDTASMDHLEVGRVREGVEEVLKIMKEFPKAKGVLNLIGGDDSSKTYAYAEFGGAIRFCGSYIPRELDKYESRDVKSGFSPDGTKWQDIAVHEFGHLLERAMINKLMPKADYWEKVAVWSNRTIASKIVDEAVGRVIASSPRLWAVDRADGREFSTNVLISKVSGYAETNRSETIAECVADYWRNRDNAKPLSKEVWKILKRELG